MTCSSIPEELELQAKALRKSAHVWLTTGIAPDLTVEGVDVFPLSLSYTDLIDDAAALEADAAKLRSVYSEGTRYVSTRKRHPILKLSRRHRGDPDGGDGYPTPA